jgi:hypothetical protein
VAAGAGVAYGLRMSARETIVEITVALALALGAGCAHKAAPAEATDPQAVSIAVGAKAPDGSLTQTSGTQIALADVLRQHAQTIVVFYRGFY